jgi:hypothetical protein
MVIWPGMLSFQEKNVKLDKNQYPKPRHATAHDFTVFPHIVSALE